MPAQATVSFTDLHLARIWTPAQGGTIAPNEPDAAKIVYEPDGFRLYTIASKEYAGWMARCSLGLPPLPPQFTLSISIDVECDDAAALVLQALELDAMVSMADGRVGNTSTEYNIKAGGHAQIIDQNYKWADIGFNPGPLPERSTFDYFNSYDQTAGVSSVQRVSIGGVPFSVPITMQKIPFQNLKWDKNRLILQVQPNMVKEGGACSFKITGFDATVQYPL